jgi:tetratricopeptide (TPR) repeat protein
MKRPANFQTRGVFVMKLLIAIIALWLWGCTERAVKAPAPQVLTRADSLWLSKDYAEVGWDQYSYEDFDKGLEFFDLALSYDSTHSQAWHGRALMLDHFERALDAEYAYRQSEKFDSTNRQAIWHLGCHYARAGAKDKALRQLRTVIALDSSYAIGVRTESCWTALWDDPDFLATVGAGKQ